METTQYSVIAEEKPRAMKKIMIGMNQVIMVVMLFFSGIEAIDSQELTKVKTAAKTGKT